MTQREQDDVLINSLTARLRFFEQHSPARACLEARDEGRGGCGACSVCCKEQYDRAEQAERERDALKAVHEEWRTQWQDAVRLRDGACAERDAAVANAEMLLIERERSDMYRLGLLEGAKQAQAENQRLREALGELRDTVDRVFPVLVVLAHDEGKVLAPVLRQTIQQAVTALTFTPPADVEGWEERRAAQQARLVKKPSTAPVCQHRWHESPGHGQSCIHCGAPFPGPEET